MPQTLKKRLGLTRDLHGGEAVLLALSVAAADLGATVERIFRSHGLTHVHYAILRMLRGAGDRGLRHAEIVERLLLGSPDVTRHMKRLEAKGWVTRLRAAEDRRVVVHRIARKGLTKLQDLDEPLGTAYDLILREMGDAAAAEVVECCERVLRTARRMNASAGRRRTRR